MKNQIRIFSLFFCLGFVSFKVYAQNKPAQIEYDIPNLVTTEDLSSLPKYKVEIYKGAKDDIFYINPYILPDWDDYKTQLDAISNSDRGDQKIYALRLEINFINTQIESEVKGILVNKGLAKSTNPSVNFLPFAYYLLFAKFSDGDSKPYSLIINPEGNLHAGQIVKPSVSISPYTARISGNYKLLKALYDARLFSSTISGNSFSSGYTYLSDNLTAVSKILSNQNIIQDIKGNEDFKNKTVVSNGSSSGGVGLSLGPITLGGTDDNTTTSTEVKNSRYVNKQYISNVFQARHTEIDILSIGSPEFIKTSIATATDLFTKNMESVNVRFEKINDNTYQLSIANAGHYDISGDQLKTLLSAKPSSSVSVDNEQSGGNGAVTGKNVQKGDIKTSNDISWTYDGKNYIPTSGTLYVASNTNLQDEISLKLGAFTKSGTVGMVVDMIYPNTIYREGVKTKIENSFGFPIGTITAFGGDLTKIPAGWKFCNGEALPIQGNEELFNAIGNLWGPAGNGTFNIPDLRGVFLRGIDNGRGYDIQRNVGVWQDDAFQAHWHALQQINSGGGCCNAFSQEFNKSLDDNNVGGALADRATTIVKDKATPGSIDPKISNNETRPKNYSVSYIIRWK